MEGHIAGLRSHLINMWNIYVGSSPVSDRHVDGRGRGLVFTVMLVSDGSAVRGLGPQEL